MLCFHFSTLFWWTGMCGLLLWALSESFKMPTNKVNKLIFKLYNILNLKIQIKSIFFKKKTTKLNFVINYSPQAPSRVDGRIQIQNHTNYNWSRSRRFQKWKSGYETLFQTQRKFVYHLWFTSYLPTPIVIWNACLF